MPFQSTMRTAFLHLSSALLAITTSAQAVRLTEVRWHDTGCYKIEMPMGTVYFEKDNGVSGFKSFVDPEGLDWIASYLPPGPNGDFRGFPNSVGNFGHAGRDSGSATVVVDGRTEGDVVILESSNADFTFQYWFFADRIAIKVLRSKGEYCFLLECVAGGRADATDYFVTADGRQHIPAGEFQDFSPEWFYLGDVANPNVLFLAKTPDDEAPNENHRQIRPGNQHNMDLYSFGRTGAEQKYQIRGMSGTGHVCIIGFTRADRSHQDVAAMIEGFLADPFALAAAKPETPAVAVPPARWGSGYLRYPEKWYASAEARAVADSVVQYQSPQGGWPKSTDLAQPPRTPEDIPPEGRGRANSLDNEATTLPMQFLARVATATGEAKHRDSFLRGVDYLLAAQYPNGGWPQFWPLRGDEYYSRITFNDGAMIRVMQVLRDVTAGEAPYAIVDANRRTLAAAAVQRGIECILKAQIRQEGKLTAWCAQYDEKTLAPAWARKYEPPSLSGSESVGIVRFLMSVEQPTPEIIAAVEGAVAWLRSVPITGMRLDHLRGEDGRNERRLVPDPAAPPLWARFYELGTNRPLYLDRDSVFNYDFVKVGRERRSGYDYLGDWPVRLLENDYPAWRARLEKSRTPASGAILIEAESGTFTGWVDRHSCWHNVMLTDAPHSTHSGKALVDTLNEVGSFIEVDYEATWAGPHRITARYTHTRDDPRPGELLVNGEIVATLALSQTVALPAFKTDSAVVDLRPGKNVLQLHATAAGGLPNMDYLKVAEVRDLPPGALPNIQVLEAEDGRYTGKLDHHSCWNSIAQTEAKHSGFTGEGYVDTDNKPGSHVEVTCEVPEAGSYSLAVRYVHVKNDERPAEVRINGEVVGVPLEFSRTGWWTAWSYVATPVDLRAGRNVIRLTALGTEGLVNLDHFTLGSLR